MAPGCGSSKPEFSPETQQTPDSLAQEFVFRYQGLPSQASGKAKARAATAEKAKAKAAALLEEGERKKSAQATTKKAPVATLDALIDSLELKLGEVPGVSKAEAAGKVLERLKGQSSIDEADRAVISERLGKLAGGP
jgi:hypothetical protein